MTPSPPDLPVIACALGQTPDDLLAASSFPFELTQVVKAIDLVAIAHAVRFRYVRDPGRFELPLAGIVSISFTAGVITSMRITPHLGGLTEDEACEVAAGIVPVILAAGYREVVGIGQGMDALRFSLKERSRPIDTTLLIGKWMYGDDAVLLEVTRAGVASLDRTPVPPAHMVRVRIENGPLTRKATAQVNGAGQYVVWTRKVGQ